MKRLSSLAVSNTPFLFYTNFDATQTHVYTMDELSDADIEFTFNAQEYQPHSHILKAYPIMFAPYKKGFETVIEKIKSGDICEARKKLSMIVGRDTEDLDDTAISRATIETVSENSVDGIISPLFYAAIGGAPLLWAFKAISTCDSMVGYKNDKYIKFGTFCARLDDLANYIPARLSLYIYTYS